MGSLPTPKPREVAALLEELGFAEVRQRGSHKQYRHADGRGTTVPFHPGRDISPLFPACRPSPFSARRSPENFCPSIRAPNLLKTIPARTNPAPTIAGSTPRVVWKISRSKPSPAAWKNFAPAW